MHCACHGPQAAALRAMACRPRQARRGRRLCWSLGCLSPLTCCSAFGPSERRDAGDWRQRGQARRARQARHHDAPHAGESTARACSGRAAGVQRPCSGRAAGRGYPGLCSECSSTLAALLAFAGVRWRLPHPALCRDAQAAQVRRDGYAGGTSATEWGSVGPGGARRRPGAPCVGAPPGRRQL